ncbi:hypothetical protein JCM10213_005372 [Rhodosporidiobolus nylandii]
MQDVEQPGQQLPDGAATADDALPTEKGEEMDWEGEDLDGPSRTTTNSSLSSSPFSTGRLPPELVTLVFAHLHASLGTTHSQDTHLAFPETAPFVFSPLLLVSKSFFALAAPFFLRFLNPASVAYARILLEREGLSRRAVHSIHYRQYEPPSPPATSEAFAAWPLVLQRCLPTVRRLVLSHGWQGICLPHRASEPRRALFDALNADGRLSLPALTHLHVKVAQHTEESALRRLTRVAPQLKELSISFDDQFPAQFLTTLRATTPAVPAGLETLRIKHVNVIARALLTNIFLPSLVMPSARTLTSLFLHIDLDENLRLQSFSPFTSLFAPSATPETPYAQPFPSLRELSFYSSTICCADADLFALFPSIERASLSTVERIHPDGGNFPLPPSTGTLRSLALTLTRNRAASLAGILGALETHAARFAGLEVLSVDLGVHDLPAAADEDEDGAAMQDPRLLASDVDALRGKCESLGIELRGNVLLECRDGEYRRRRGDTRGWEWIMGARYRRRREGWEWTIGREGGEGEEMTKEEEEEEEESDVSSVASSGDEDEKEEMDFDAEEDAKLWRERWSEAKQRRHVVENLFTALSDARTLFPSAQGFATEDSLLATMEAEGRAGLGEYLREEEEEEEEEEEGEGRGDDAGEEGREEE